MEYIVYKRFRGKGIDGEFNLRYGTAVTERDGFLFATDGRKICAATSENGWEHFRPNTQEGSERQKMLNDLYRWYAKHGCGEDFADEKWPGQENGYWKNRLRTTSTSQLKQIYAEKIGGKDSVILISPYPNIAGVSALKQVGVATASDASTNGGGF